MKQKRVISYLLALMLCVSSLTGAFAVSAAAEGNATADWADPTNTTYHTVLLAPQTYGNTTTQPATVYDEADYVANSAGIQYQGCYFKEPNGNVYWTTTMNNKAGFCRPPQTKMGHEGKYVVQYRMKAKALTGGAKPIVSTLVSHGGTWAGANYFGFVVRPFAAYLAQKNVGVVYRSASPAIEVESALGDDTQMIYVDDVWYTIRDTYDLDASPFVVTREIFDAQGTLLKTFSTEVSNASVAIDENKDLSFDCIRIDLNASPGTLGIDDLMVAKITAVPVNVSYDEEKMTVSYLGNPVPNGSEVAVPYNSANTASFTVTAKEGCEIGKVLVNGSPIDGTTANFTAVTEPQTLEVLSSIASDDPENGFFYQNLQPKMTFRENAAAAIAPSTQTEANVAYFKEGDNIFWAGASISTTPGKSCYFMPVNKQMGNQGEYVIQHKMKFPNCGSARTDYVGTSILVNYMTPVSSNPNCFLGFRLDPALQSDGKLMTDFKFILRGRPSGGSDIEKTITLPDDTWRFSPDEWYVFRHIYDVDTKTATLKIYTEDGKKLLKTVVYQLPEQIPETNYRIPYADFNFNYIRADVKYGGWVGVDNFLIAKTTHRPLTAEFDDRYLSVTCDGQAIAPGEDAPIPYNSAEPAAICVSAKEGQTVGEVNLNGAPTANEFSLSYVTSPQTLTAVAQGAPKAESVKTVGKARVGNTVSASAVITDEDGDTTSALYQWQRFADGEWQDIDGATEGSYEVAEEDYALRLRVRVVPMSNMAPERGLAVYSAPTSAVISSDQEDYYQITQPKMTWQDHESEAILPSELTESGAVYFKQDDNVFWAGATTGSTPSKSLYLRPDNGQMGSDGEYIVEQKMYFPTISTARPDYYATSILVNYMNPTNSNPNCFLGFRLEPAQQSDAKLLTDFKFILRGRPSGGSDIEKTITLPDEAWRFAPSNWYLFREIFNVHDKTATLEIYNEDGSELLKKVSYELPETIPDTSYQIPYGNFNFCYLRADVRYGGWVGVDDLMIAKTTHRPLIAAFDAEKASVVYDGEELLPGEPVPIPYNSAVPAVLTVTGKGANLIDSVTVNGQPQSNVSEISLVGVTESQTMIVTVKEPPKVESLRIGGVAQVGQTVSADAVITDLNGDQTSATYQWQIGSDDDWNDLPGEDGRTCAVTEDYKGKQLRVIVTPISDAEPRIGLTVTSEPTPAVIDPTLPPSASDVIVDGTAAMGNQLSVTYSYTPSTSGLAEGTSEIVWETADSRDGAYTAVQTSDRANYNVTVNDIGKWIRVRVIPKDIYGVAGNAVCSEAMQVAKKMLYFVATDGSDDNPGTFDAPFATIEKARNTVRALQTLPDGGIEINLRGGVYPVKKTMEFTAADSGTEACPIEYRAYRNERVVFEGGQTLDTSAIEKVTDSAILNRLVDEKAKDHLYCLNLAEQGVTMTAPSPYGRGYGGYNPKRIMMNGSLLTEARWPNNDQSQHMIACSPLLDGIDKTKFNGENMPVKLIYPDPDNRSAKWTVKPGESSIGGAVVVFWGQVNLRIAEIDTARKIVTSQDASSYSLIPGAVWGQQYKIYFSNIFEEIDQPGESYVDRENGMLYFYPIGDVDGAEMTVSDFTDPMLTATDTDYVTFRGFTFRGGRSTMVRLKNTDSVHVEDSVFTQSGGAMDLTGCTNTVVAGNHCYGLNGNAVSISGGDRTGLTSSGNVIENNRFHHYGLFRNGFNGVYLSGCVGEIIRHNEFDDFDQSAVLMEECNDILIEYNRILNGMQSATDYGSIYWGRNTTMLGIVIRYNYFENIGSQRVSVDMASGMGASIFWDDAATGPEIYGNVFFDAGADRGSIASNGGEFARVYGNVFIGDRPEKHRYATYLNAWGNTNWTYEDQGKTVAVKKFLPARSWAYTNDMRAPVIDRYGANSNLWSQARKDMMFSQSWQDHYRGTQWQETLEHYSREHYEGAKYYYDRGDRNGLLKYIDENLKAERTNHLHDNVILGLLERYDEETMTFNEYLGSSSEIREEDRALFVDYDARNFALTEAGLAKVREFAPDFEQIPFDEIGLTSAIGGHKPVATIRPETVIGTVAAGNELNAAYTYFDADGDEETTTRIYWYRSDSENGVYRQIVAAQGSYTPVLQDEGKYLKYQVIPYDTNSLRGAGVWSAPIYLPVSAQNAELKAMSIGETPYSKFASTVTEYDYALPILARKIPAVTAEAVSEKAKVEISPAVSLPGTTTVTVTAEDGVTKKVYSIHFDRLPSARIDDGTYTYAVSDNEAILSGTVSAPSGKMTVPSAAVSASQAAYGYPVTAVGEGAFENASALTGIMLPDSVKSIGEEAFKNANGLKTAILSRMITVIEPGTFDGCSSLERIVIPAGVGVISENAFRGCDCLSDIYFTGTEEQWNGIRKETGNNALGNAVMHYGFDYADFDYAYLFNGDEATIVSTIEAPVGEITLPTAVASMYSMYSAYGAYGISSMYSMYSMYSVYSAYSSYSAYGYRVTAVGDYAFFYCDRLTRVTIPETITSIGEGAFAYDEALEEIDIPDTVTALGEYAFNGCTAMTTAIIGEGVSEIPANAFGDCVSLGELMIGSQVTSIGEGAFAGCEDLSLVFFMGTQAQWDRIAIGDNNEPLLQAEVICLGTEDYLPGDANLDGTVNVADAILVLKHSAGLIKLEDTALLAADVTGDGIVDESDAVLILQYDSGLIEVL